MTGLSSPEDVLATELKEIYSAERQLSRAIPKLAKKTSSDRLRQMLDRRCEQGAALIEELDDTLDDMDVPKARPKNIAAEGLIDDTNHHIEEIEDEKLLDPVLLASMQKIEHYCIASWGSAKAIGRLLGQDKVVKTMQQVLDEGKRFDEEMTKLAEEEVNPAMLADDEGYDDSDQDEEKSEASSQGRRRKRRPH
jgi:ferritin-like metal-binding protein YciE